MVFFYQQNLLIIIKERLDFQLPKKIALIENLKNLN